MSQQTSGQSVSPRVSSTTFHPATSIPAPLSRIDSGGLQNEELSRRVDEPHQRSVSGPRQDVDFEPSRFRALGVDAILNTPVQPAPRAISSSGYAAVASATRPDTFLPGASNASHTTSSMPGDVVEPSRRDSGSSQPATGRLSTLSPSHIEQARTTRASPGQSSNWLNAALRSAPPGDSPMDVKFPDRIPPSSVPSARNSFASQEIRGSQASPIERHSLARFTASSSSPDTSMLKRERVSVATALGPRDLASSGDRATGGDPGRKRSTGNEYSMNKVDQKPLTRSSAMLPGTQYMTLQTDQGPVSFPVDVQAASRGADEKRKRNAGASARFRARRKEREQANSREIDELRQTIRDLGEEVEFYRRERDYMASALQQQGSQRDRHFPRPLSPRRRRLSQQSVDAEVTRASGLTQDIPALYQERGERGSFDRQTRQRLSGEFSYSDPSAATSPLAPSNYRERTSGQQQAFVPPLQQQVQASAQFQQQEIAGRYAASQGPQIQDPHGPRDLSRTYDPSSSRMSE